MVFKANKRLGKADGPRRYDLPLHKDKSARFLRVFIALMAFLLSLGVFMVMGLHGLSQSWSDQIQSQITVEIPSVRADRSVRSQDEISQIQQSVLKALQNKSYILDVQVQSAQGMQDKIESWLGPSSDLLDIPVPGMVSVMMEPRTENAADMLQDDLSALVDDHGLLLHQYEDWLADIAKLSFGLQLATWIVMGMIVVTVFISISGAVQAQIDIHAKDVELLHLIGARDSYILGQFMRHFTVMTWIWGSTGVAFSVLMGGVFYSLFPLDQMTGGQIDAPISLSNIGFLLAVPLMLALFALGASLMTVTRVLKQMV